MPHRQAKAMEKELDKKRNANVFIAPANPLPAERKPLEPKEIVYARAKKMLVPKGASAEEQAKHHHKKTSKRTATSNELPGESAPAHIHPEGARWVKTLNKQARMRTQMDTKKMNKLRSAKKR